MTTDCVGVYSDLGPDGTGQSQQRVRENDLPTHARRLWKAGTL